MHILTYIYLNELGQIFHMIFKHMAFPCLRANIHNSTIDTTGIKSMQKKSEKKIIQ